MALAREQGRETSGALALRIRSGDATAEVELVQRYGRGLQLILRQLTPNRELAKDLFQDTFRVVLLRLRSAAVDLPAHLAAFIRQVAINLATMEHRKILRRERVEAEGLDLEAMADHLATPYGKLEEAEMRAAVRGYIAGLPVARDREILWGYYVLEQDKETLCARFALTGEHFDRVLSRARLRLRHVLPRNALPGTG